MKLDQTLYARVPRTLKNKLSAEARRRRAQGHNTKDADILREALVQYFQIRETGKVTA